MFSFYEIHAANEGKQFGNFLHGQVFFDAAHQEDYEHDLKQEKANNKYLPCTQDPNTLEMLPDEMIAKILDLSIEYDLATQYTLYHIFARNHALERFCDRLVVNTNVEDTTMLSAEFLSLAALDLITTGTQKCPRRYAKYYILLCDMLAHGYVTLLNWYMTTHEPVFALVHGILDGFMGSRTIREIKEKQVVQANPSYTVRVKQREFLLQQLMHQFGVDPSTFQSIYKTAPQQQTDLQTALNKVNAELEKLSPTTTLSLFEEIVREPNYNLQFSRQKSLVALTKNAAWNMAVGLLASYLVSPFFGPVVDTSSFQATLETSMAGKPCWEWEFFSKEQSNMLKARNLTLPNIFNLYNTEWDEITGGTLDGSLFKRTRGNMDSRLLETSVEFLTFFCHNTRFTELFRSVRHSKHGVYTFRDQIILATLEAGNVLVYQHLAKRGILSSHDNLENLLSFFPDIVKKNVTTSDNIYSTITYGGNIDSSAEYHKILNAILFGILKDRRYRTLTLSIPKTPTQFTYEDYLNHIRILLSLLFQIVEPILNLDSKHTWSCRWQMVSSQYNPFSKPYLTFSLELVVDCLVVNKQWDMISWLASQILTIRTNPEISRIFAARNEDMDIIQAKFLWWLLRSAKRMSRRKERIVPILEWIKVNIHQLFYTDMREKHYASPPGSSPSSAMQDFPTYLLFSWVLNYSNDGSIFIDFPNHESEEIPQEYKNLFHKELKSLLTDPDCLTGVETFHYLIETCSIHRKVPICLGDGGDISCDGIIHGDTPMVFVESEVVDQAIRLDCELAIAGVCHAMTFDMAFASQKLTPLTPWAMAYFNWNRITLVDLEQVKHSIKFRNEHTNWKLYDHVSGALAHLHTFCRLYPNLPLHLQSLCPPNKTLLDIVIDKLFPFSEKELIDLVISDFKDTQSHKDQIYFWSNKLNYDTKYPFLLMSAQHRLFMDCLTEFWLELTVNALSSWNRWTKPLSLAFYGYYNMATQSRNNDPHILQTIASSIHRMPKNILALLGGINLESTQRRWELSQWVLNQAQVQIPPRLLGNYFNYLHSTAFQHCMTNNFALEFLAASNNVSLTQWFYETYGLPLPFESRTSSSYMMEFTDFNSFKTFERFVRSRRFGGREMNPVSRSISWGSYRSASVMKEFEDVSRSDLISNADMNMVSKVHFHKALRSHHWSHDKELLQPIQVHVLWTPVGLRTLGGFNDDTVVEPPRKRFKKEPEVVAVESSSEESGWSQYEEFPEESENYDSDSMDEDSSSYENHSDSDI